MASTQDLKRRVRSITNTRKVTKAMELVASARLRRSQQRIEAMRPYADRMLELMAGVSQAAGAVRLPLLERRENVQKVAIVPISADRGLAGGFNAQVIRRALALQREAQAEGQEVVWFSTGRKAASTLRFRRLNVIQSWTGFSERPAYRDAQVLAHAVSEAFVNGEVDRVVVVYNAFVSALTQRVTVRELLPISPGADRGRRPRPRRTFPATPPTSSTSPSPRRSWPGSCRSTSRRSSTAPCSNRPPPSRAPA